jgi:hypothetical protein
MAIRKNTRFIDPRYFMDEKMETIKEVQEVDRMQEIAGVGSGATDPRQRRTPAGTGQRVEAETAQVAETAFENIDDAWFKAAMSDPDVRAAVEQAATMAQEQAVAMQEAHEPQSDEEQFADVAGVTAGAGAAAMTPIAAAMLVGGTGGFIQTTVMGALGVSLVGASAAMIGAGAVAGLSIALVAYAIHKGYGAAKRASRGY